MGQKVFGHVVRRVAAHLLPRDGREGVARAGEQQFQIVVDLGRRADGRAGVARIDLLLDGDGRGNPLDDVDIRLVDLSEELPGIGREALHVAALPFGKDRVEGQGRFSGSRQTGDDDQFFVRDLERDVAQVVDPRPLDIYAVFVFFHIGSAQCSGRFSNLFSVCCFIRRCSGLCRFLARAPSFTFILRHSHTRVPPVPTPGPRLSRSSSVFLTPDLCCIHARPVVSVSSIPLRRFHARSRSDPPALRSRSSRRSARVSRIVSRMVQRLSNSCASMRGCSSLTTRMMSFIAT